MVDVHEASPFTLYGAVVTTEQTGALTCNCEEVVRGPELSAGPRRIELPLA